MTNLIVLIAVPIYDEIGASRKEKQYWLPNKLTSF